MGFLARLGLAVTVLASQGTGAAVVFDTGPGFGAGAGGASLVPEQWYAGRFSVSEAVTIQTVQGWIVPTGPGRMTATLYSSSIGMQEPVPLTPLFSAGFNLNWVGSSILDQSASWLGPGGLNWVVSPGAYWLAFEVRPGDAGGYMPGGVPQRVQEAVSQNAGLSWSNTGGSLVRRGYRAFDDRPANAVPSPATLALLVAGFAAAAGSARRAKRA